MIGRVNVCDSRIGRCLKKNLCVAQNVLIGGRVSCRGWSIGPDKGEGIVVVVVVCSNGSHHKL